MSPAFDPSQFIDRFVEEAKDHLAHLNECLLKLEKSGHDAELFEEVLRRVHTLKGSSKMLGLDDVAEVSHLMEDSLLAITKKGRDPISAGFDMLFRLLDALSARVDALGAGEKQPLDLRGLTEGIESLRQRGGAKPAKKPAAAKTAPVAGQPPPRRTPAADGSRAGAAAHHRESLRVSSDKIDQLAGVAAEMTIQNLRAAERHRHARQLVNQVRKLRTGLKDLVQPEARPAKLRASKHEEGLELLHRELRQLLEDLDGDCARLNLISEELRRSVMDISMVPLSTVFDAFPRTVRDVGKEFGKIVDLTVRGGDVQLDKKIVEAIGDPLVHILRNAVAHGIKSPAERQRAGKPPQGLIALEASREGNRILITVADDGAGIDPRVVRAVAAEGDMVSRDKLERWSDEEVLSLIFQPGFSTSRDVNNLAGRGVGMDAVKKAVEHLNGTIRIYSDVGVGTRVVLDLPLTLAVMRGVLVQSGQELFAVPTPAIERIVYVNTEQMLHVNDNLAFDWEGETVLLVPLENVLEVHGARAAQQPWPVIIARTMGRRFGLLADAVLPEQEFVFKELPVWLREQENFSGATILGDGRIVLILESDAIFQSASRREKLKASFVLEDKLKGPPAAILVVEDSFITGELERSILQAAGYRAEIACDGVNALDMLRNHRFDLVLADLDMPRMDGIQLIAELQQQHELRDIPVIIMTGRDSDEDRRRGLQAGAHAFFRKRDFDQDNLLETIRRLVGR